MPQSPVTPPLIGLVLVVIVLTIFAWRWAVRQPVLTAPQEEPAVEEEKASPPFVYAAIGASDVEGVGSDDPQNDSWVNLLSRHLPPDMRLVRLGRGGITLNEANKLEVPQAVAAAPDLVTLWNCANDAVRGIPLPLYLRDLRSALDRLTGETEAHVLLLNLPDLSLLLPAGDPRRELVRGGVLQWNAGMVATALGYGSRVTLVDLFPASAHLIEHPELVSADSFHPSSEGYRWLAEHVWGVIEGDRLPGS